MSVYGDIDSPDGLESEGQKEHDQVRNIIDALNKRLDAIEKRFDVIDDALENGRTQASEESIKSTRQTIDSSKLASKFFL